MTTKDSYIETGKLFLGYADTPIYLDMKYLNRHGLIAGATGTGKTVTLQVMAESLSGQGVPVFLVDVKGDLSGLSMLGNPNEKLKERAKQVHLSPYDTKGFPTIFWDLEGRLGHPVHATISEMGPLLLTRLLELSEVQEGILHMAFAIADNQGLLMLDLKDLKSMLGFMVENRKEFSKDFGRITQASVGAIQRRLMILEEEGADFFFGEPALKLSDLFRKTFDGQGFISILSAQKLILKPKLYATFLLWLLSELYEDLQEVGDLEKPKLVLFFDEAHLLFDDMPKALLDKIEQVVRLIRSKGIGIFFVTQNPQDIPQTIGSQLGNRVQHALRAFTPREQKAVKVAAQTLRSNPKFDAQKVITALQVGEALVSSLGDKGIPTIVERTLIRPPASRLGPITDKEYSSVMKNSPVGGVYDTVIDRQSAYEILKSRAEEIARKQSENPATVKKSRRTTKTAGDAMWGALARSLGTQIGRALGRGILGSLFRR